MYSRLGVVFSLPKVNTRRLKYLHIFKLVHPPLSIPFPHFPQGLVLVPPLLHILAVDLVHCSLLL